MKSLFRYRVVDPETGLYWQGDVPGTFGPHTYEFSEERWLRSALQKYARHEAGLAKPRRPDRLRIERYEFVRERMADEEFTISSDPTAGAYRYLRRKGFKKNVIDVFDDFRARTRGSMTSYVAMMPISKPEEARTRFHPVLRITGSWVAVQTWANAFSLMAAYEPKTVVNLEELFAEVPPF